MKLLSALKYDMLFQLKHGIYYLYTIVTIFYLVILHFINFSVRDNVTILMIISDPVVLGFFFIGGIVLLEKDNNILQALFVTPLKIDVYMISKILSLLMIILISSLVIATVGFGTNINYSLFIITIVITGSIFTLLGMALASKVNSLNSYIFISSFFELILFSPLLKFFGIVDISIFKILPSDAAISLVKLSINNNINNIYDSLTSMGILCIWLIISYYLARKLIYKNIIINIGDEK